MYYFCKKRDKNDLFNCNANSKNRFKKVNTFFYKAFGYIFKATPHKACAAETQIYFSSDCIEFLKAYCRMMKNYV